MCSPRLHCGGHGDQLCDVFDFGGSSDLQSSMSEQVGCRVSFD